MRKSVLVILLLTFLTCSYASDKPQLFFQATEIDVGEVPFLQDEIIVKFTYFNRTGKNVVIQKVKPSCGCTDVKYPKHPIRKREKGEITATVRLNSSEGHFSKSILIYADGLKPTVLKIKGKK